MGLFDVYSNRLKIILISSACKIYTTHTNSSIKYSFPIGMMVLLNRSAFELLRQKIIQWLHEILKIPFHLANELHALFRYRIKEVTPKRNDTFLTWLFFVIK